MKLDVFIKTMYFGWALGRFELLQAHLEPLLFFADRRLYFLSVTILHPSPIKKNSVQRIAQV